MKNVRAGLAILMAFTLAVAQAAGALAAGYQKDEVVYYKLDATGTPETCVVVNAFEADAPCEARDVGAYTDVVNLSGLAPLSYEGGAATLQLASGRTYVQGTLAGAPCPWRIAVAYALDGEPVTAEALAGRDGAFEMTLSVSPNPDDAGAYASRFTLQASITLDANRFANIDAPGGTLAVSGGSRTVSYMVLPGATASYTLRAHVTDARLASVQLAGVPLSLDAEQIDVSAFTAQFAPLTTGVSSVNDGVQALSTGLSELSTGAGTFRDGLSAFADGLTAYLDGVSALAGGGEALRTGAAQIADGLSQIVTGMNENLSADTTGLSLLTVFAGLIATGTEVVAQDAQALADSFGEAEAARLEGGLSVEDISAGNAALIARVDALVGEEGEADDAALTPEHALLLELRAQLSSADALLAAQRAQLQQVAADAAALSTSASQVKTTYGTLNSGLSTLPDMVTQLTDGVSALSTGLTSLQEGMTAFTLGLDEYTGGVDTLAAQNAQLKEALTALNTGASGVADGAAQVATGAATLATGTATLNEGLSALDLDAEVRGAVSGMMGGGGEIQSFVSPENGAVRSVQFVLLTPTIEKVAEIVPAPEKKPETLVERIVKLFK